MKCFRGWLLILLLLVLGGGQTHAATREDRAFAAAAAAFQDEFWARAETQFSQFIQKYPQSSRVAEAVLLTAQAQFKQGKYTAAIHSLTASWVNPGPLADQFAYWLGEAQFAQGDFDHAADTFAAFPAKYPDSPLTLAAAVEAASACERLGDWLRLEAVLVATNGVFARSVAAGSTNELVARGRLLLATARLAEKDYPAALTILKSLETWDLPAGLAWQRANLLCRVQVGAGDFSAALATATNLLELARSQDAPRLADSVAWRSTILEKMDRWPEAGAAWTENLSSNTPPEWQREAVLRVAGAAMAQKKFAAAQAALEKYLAGFPQAPAADFARLTLGELLLKDFLADETATNRLVQAQAIFEQVLAATNRSAAGLTGKALLDRGWCFWLAGKQAEASGNWAESAQHLASSLVDFRAAAARLPFSEELAVAQFKTGDALFALKDFAGARQSYQAVLDSFGNVASVAESLGERALYQILRANLELKDLAGADRALRQMLEKYPDSNLADNSLLLLGEGFSETGAAADAMKAFRDFAVLFPQSPLTPQVELARARALERAGDWPAAVTNYQGWLQAYPTNALRPQVEYTLGRASFQAGNEAGALAAFTNFVAHHPTNDLAPLAQWWVADYFFRLGGTNYVEAEKNYELIFQTPAWQKSDLFYPAQLMAARAATARLGYADAANYLTKLVTDTNCPPALVTQARFAYGGVLMHMDSPDTNQPLANFEAATNVFAQLCQAYPTNELGALAWSELGDCNFQLGALDAATNAYQQVMDSPYAAVGLRSRAQVGLGRVLEKMAETAAPDEKKSLLNQALNHYLDVFDGKNLRPGEQEKDPFWMKKAGLQALPLMISLKTGSPDKFIDRLELALPALKDSLEKKRASLRN